MSSELEPEFQYLALYAALSGRPSFTKSDLGIEMKAKEIEALSKETRLLEVARKGNALHISANKETLRWAGEHLNINLEGKKNKAVLAILHLIQARTDAYLKAHQVSMEDFLDPAGQGESEQSIDAVRRSYLALSGGKYQERVLLKDLRKQLGLSRQEQDETFMQMIRSGEADFYPEDDPMSRDEEDDRAALVLADRRRHVMYLHREPRA